MRNWLSGEWTGTSKNSYICILHHNVIIMEGYIVKDYGRPFKRYCRTMDLKDDPGLIAEYRLRHAEGNIWPEIIAGIRQVGILEMEIYILDNRLFMIMDTEVDFDWDSAMAKLASLPRQQEWEDYMSVFQQAEKGMTADMKWRLMERMFHLYDK